MGASPEGKKPSETQLRQEPGKGMKVEIPDMKKQEEGLADSVFVEDVLHCSPSMLLEHHVAMPSMFRARQNKHREIVVFDHHFVYPEYAILFYEYEDEKAMLENIPLEYPQNRHGVDPGKNALYFLLQAQSSSKPSPDEQSEKAKDEGELPDGSKAAPDGYGDKSKKPKEQVKPPPPDDPDPNPDAAGEHGNGHGTYQGRFLLDDQF